MKKVLLLAHDPGGYDVISALSNFMQTEQFVHTLLCAGPASELQTGSVISIEHVLARVQYELDRGDYSALVCGTSWGSTMELIVIQKFKEKHLPTIAVLDYWSYYSNRFMIKSETYVFPDYFIVMDEMAEKEAIEDNIPPEIIRVFGHPGLDQLLDVAARKPENKSLNFSKMDNPKLKLLFISQPVSVAHGSELGFTEEDVIQDLLSLQLAEPRISLNIKFHPKDDVIYRKSYAHMEAEGHLYRLLPEYDLVVGMSSMALFHSILLGTAAISYQPNLKTKDDCITNKLGLTKTLTEFKQLKEEIDSFLLQTNVRDFQSNYRWIDGKSSKRILNFIKEVWLGS